MTLEQISELLRQTFWTGLLVVSPILFAMIMVITAGAYVAMTDITQYCQTIAELSIGNSKKV